MPEKKPDRVQTNFGIRTILEKAYREYEGIVLEYGGQAPEWRDVDVFKRAAFLMFAKSILRIPGDDGEYIGVHAGFSPDFLELSASMLKDGPDSKRNAKK